MTRYKATATSLLRRERARASRLGWRSWSASMSGLTASPEKQGRPTSAKDRDGFHSKLLSSPYFYAVHPLFCSLRVTFVAFPK